MRDSTSRHLVVAILCVAATQGKKTVSFFTMPEYEAWKESTNNGRGWDIRYYKGSWLFERTLSSMH